MSDKNSGTSTETTGAGAHTAGAFETHGSTRIQRVP